MTPDRLSFWMLLTGVRYPWCWITMGLGWCGIVWERAGGSRIHRRLDPKALTLSGVLWHVPVLLSGIYRVTRG